MIENKFKVGDKVRVNVYEIQKGLGVPYSDEVTEDYNDGIIGYMYEDDGGMQYAVCTCYNGNYDNEYAIVTEDKLELIEAYDPKREFLERLQRLLRDYNAQINISWNDCFDNNGAPRIDMDICFGDGSGIDFENALDYTITADNIMDFE